MLTATINRTRRIGAEFEMTVPLVGTGTGRDIQETLARVLSQNGVRAIARGYDHSLLPPTVDVAVEYDSSIHGESQFNGIQWFPVEVKTRILTLEEWERVTPRMLEICRYMGARVNPSCGHHVHLSFDESLADIRHVRSIWNLFHRFDQVIFGLVAPSRRQSHYCRHMPQESKLLHRANSRRSLARALGPFDRYQAFNLTHVQSSAPRIEFRHHHGTLDPQKARHWLRFLMRLVDHAVQRSCQAAPAPLPNTRRNLEKLLITVGLKVNTRVYGTVDAELRETGRWVLRTWKKFNGHAPLKRTQTTNVAAGERED